MTDLYPELKSTIGRTETGDKEVLFYDSLSMLTLEPRETGKKMIISNYNTVSPSVRASLSIYENDGKSLFKNRVQKYTETAGWEMDQDLDYISCQEHMRNIGNRTLRSRPDYKLINYPPSLYMAMIEKDDDGGDDDDDDYNDDNNDRRRMSLLEYPDIDIADKITQRKRKLDNELDPNGVHYEGFSKFVPSNFESGSSEATNKVFIGRKKRVKLNYSNNDIVMTM